jgi:hypothetical protein
MSRDFNTPPLPLESVTLRHRDHIAALWWLGWLYRNPDAFLASLKQLGCWRATRAVGVLYLHALPWLFLFVLAGHTVLFELGLTNPEWSQLTTANRSLTAIAWTVVGLVINLIVGLGGGVLIVGSGSGLTRGLVIGLCATLALSLSGGGGIFLDLGSGLGGGLLSGLASGLILGLVFYFVVSPLFYVGFGLIFCSVILVIGALAFSSDMVDPLGFLIGFLTGYYRPYNSLLHAPFLFLRRRPSFYRFHPAAWDRLCWAPFPWFDRLLVGYGGLDSARMEEEIHRVIHEVSGQRLVALRAWTILRTRKAAQVTQLSQLATVVADLPEGKRGYLAETRRVRELVESVVRQQFRLDETTRPYFREIEARNLVAEIRNFQGRVSGMREPLATEFQKAANAWLMLAEAQVADAGEAIRAEPAPQVFRAGVPVEGEREAFIPRLRVLEQLEGQIMLATGCPGVLLRAPRRMGKSSLLKNVAAFLPRDTAVVFESLQSARLFSSIAYFVDGLAEAVQRRLPASGEFDSLRQSRQTNSPADLAGFLRFLTECNAALERTGRRLLVALDEYEMLDAKLREGVFTRDLLATLRESIQSHRRIIWAFAGNADITELTGADWTSYLISVRTLEVPLFTSEETRLLLTQPLQHSALRDEDKAKSALFWREFWGDDGIARIHTESGGWPYFVQLVAETAVTLANEIAPGGAPLSSELLERALDESTARGRNTFIHLLQSQSQGGSGEWEYLAGFAKHETQPPPADPEVRRRLKRRQLVTETPEGEWRLVVPLMARWLRMES